MSSEAAQPLSKTPHHDDHAVGPPPPLPLQMLNFLRSERRFNPPAKVSRKASAKSGERSPLFFISSLRSTMILPVTLKVYVGVVSSVIRSSSSGIEHIRS